MGIDVIFKHRHNILHTSMGGLHNDTIFLHSFLTRELVVDMDLMLDRSVYHTKE